MRNEGGWDGSTFVDLLRIRRYLLFALVFELNASSSRARDLYSNGVYYWRFGLLQEYSCVIMKKLPLTTNELEVLGYCEGKIPRYL